MPRTELIPLFDEGGVELALVLECKACGTKVTIALVAGPVAPGFRACPFCAESWVNDADADLPMVAALQDAMNAKAVGYRLLLEVTAR